MLLARCTGLCNGVTKTADPNRSRSERPAEQAIDDIVAIARRAPGDGWHPSRTRFVAADVAADDLAPHLRDVDAVIHLAWLFQPTHAPMTTWRANVEGSIRVFEAAAAAGVT